MENNEELTENTMTHKEGIYSNKNWDEIEFPIERDCIPD